MARAGGKHRIVTAFAYYLASNEVKLLGHRRKVDLKTMNSCEESNVACMRAREPVQEG